MDPSLRQSDRLGSARYGTARRRSGTKRIYYTIASPQIYVFTTSCRLELPTAARGDGGWGEWEEDERAGGRRCVERCPYGPTTDGYSDTLLPSESYRQPRVIELTLEQGRRSKAKHRQMGTEPSRRPKLTHFSFLLSQQPRHFCDTNVTHLFLSRPVYLLR